MRYITTLFLLFIPLFAFCQQDIPLGKGLLDIHLNNTSDFTLSFYTDTTASMPAKRIGFIKRTGEDVVLQDESQVMTWLAPEALKTDYNLFFMRVIQRGGKWYQVVVNKHTGATLWIKAATGQTFRNWPEFLQHRVTWIGKHKDYTPAIKATPSDQSKTLKKIESTDCFEVLEVKGDWMRICTHTQLECNESKQTLQSGWIRWRQNNRLMIDYGLSC